MLKNLPAKQEMWGQSLGQEDPLEEEMATHPSILAGRIPWTEQPGRLQFTGSQRHDCSDLARTHMFIRKRAGRLQRINNHIIEHIFKTNETWSLFSRNLPLINLLMKCSIYSIISIMRPCV